MAIKTRCPHCGESFRIREGHLGRRVQCKDCSTVFTAQAPGANDDPFAGVSDVAGDGDDEFAHLLNEAVTSEQQSEAFDPRHEARKGRAVFRTGFWPFYRETEIVRDDEGLFARTRHSLCGIDVAWKEFDGKNLQSIGRRFTAPEDEPRFTWKRVLWAGPIMGPVTIVLAILLTVPKDWAIHQFLSGVIQELMALTCILFFFCLFFAGQFLRAVSRTFAYTPSGYYKAKARLGSMGKMRGSWREGEDVIGRHFVALSLANGKDIPIYHGRNFELAEEAANKAARITGLPMMRIDSGKKW